MEGIPQELLALWREREEIEAVYLLPTSTAARQDVLLWITESPLSYFERLDLYYPPERRRPELRVYPITKREFDTWPEGVRRSVTETLKRSKVLFRRRETD